MGKSLERSVTSAWNYNSAWEHITSLPRLTSSTNNHCNNQSINTDDSSHDYWNNGSHDQIRFGHTHRRNPNPRFCGTIGSSKAYNNNVGEQIETNLNLGIWRIKQIKRYDTVCLHAKTRALVAPMNPKKAAAAGVSACNNADIILKIKSVLYLGYSFWGMWVNAEDSCEKGVWRNFNRNVTKKHDFDFSFYCVFCTEGRVEETIFSFFSFRPLKSLPISFFFRLISELKNSILPLFRLNTFQKIVSKPAPRQILIDINSVKPKLVIHFFSETDSCLPKSVTKEPRKLNERSKICLYLSKNEFWRTSGSFGSSSRIGFLFWLSYNQNIIGITFLWFPSQTQRSKDILLMTPTLAQLSNFPFSHNFLVFLLGLNSYPRDCFPAK